MEEEIYSHDFEEEPEEVLVAQEEIERIDHQIHQLLNERAELAIEIAQHKLDRGDHIDRDEFLRPEKEAEILQLIHENNDGPLSDYAVANIFRAIMIECLTLQINAEDE